MNVFLQAAALVSELPGSLVYHLVLLFATGVSLAVALVQWRLAVPASAAAAPAGRGRLTLAAGLLFGLRVLALVVALLAALGLLDALVAVPPLERAVSTLSILIIFWFLIFPQSLRVADAAFGLLAILVMLGLAISWGLWLQQAPLLHFYNGSPQETAWEAAQLFLIIVGALLLSVRRPVGWLLGLAIAGLLLAAHFLHYAFVIGASNVSGIERLFEIIVLPLVAAAVLRRVLPPTFLASAAPYPPPALTQGSTAPIPASDRAGLPAPASLDVRAAAALAALGTAADYTALAQSASVGIAHALPAPLSLVMRPAESGFTVDCVYQSSQQQFVALAHPVLADRPEIHAGLDQDEMMLWALGDKEAELRALAQASGLNPEGPALLVPVRLPGGPLLGAFGALPPADQAAWSSQQQAWLKSLAQPTALAWQAAVARAIPAVDPTDLITQRDQAITEAAQLRQAGQTQAAQIQRLERDAATHADELVELEALRAHLQALGPDIDLARQQQHDLETQLEHQRQQTADLQAELDRVQTLSVAAAEDTSAPEPTAAAVLAATTEAAALRTTLGMLQPQLDYYRQQEQQLQTQLDQVRAELAARQDPAPVPVALPELETLRANLQTLAGEIDAYRAEQTRLETELAQTHQSAAQLQAAGQEQQQLAAQLQAQLDQARATDAERVHLQDLESRLEAASGRAQQLADELAQRAAEPAPSAQPNPTNSFMDPDEGLAEMLEALADAEARLTQQTQQIAALQAALADSEQKRRAPTPVVARPVQAADMEVIASLAQELRQPMSSIIGYVDLLLSESVGIIGALQRKFLERIKASSERTGVLLDDLMRVMDIDSGHLELAQESVNVAQVIDDALRGSQSQFSEKGLQLVTDIPPNLPPVTADRDALLQILSHLINNSGAASANDTAVHLSVRHESEQRPGADPLNYLIFSITDTGGGIAPEDQPRVFSRLYRAEAPLIGGLGDNGMGLSIAKALVEGHGGRIWVISDPGAGSTFYVLLPLEGKYAKANGVHP